MRRTRKLRCGEGKKKLQSLKSYDHQRLLEVLRGKSKLLNGLACPACGRELYDILGCEGGKLAVDLGGVTLPQTAMVCTSCGWTGRRLA